MKDGYYISAYLTADLEKHVLSIVDRHDLNLCLWRKKEEGVELVRYWEVERFSGYKHHEVAFHSYSQIIEFCNERLQSLNMSLSDIEEIWGTEGIVERSQVKEKKYDFEGFNRIAYHSIWHMFSVLLSNTEIFFKDNILCFSIDGGPDCEMDKNAFQKKFYCSGISRKGNVENIESVFSPGYLWIFVKKYIHLQEGSLMALATATTCELINYPDFGSFWCSDIEGLSIAENYVKNLVEYVYSIDLKEEGTKFMNYDELFTEIENRNSMIGKIIQEITFKIMENNIDNMITQFGVDPKEFYLAMSGGVALNCPMNSYLMKKYGFKGFLSVPHVSDPGISIGIGLFHFWKRMGRFKFMLESSYYGEEYSFSSLLLNREFEKYIQEIETKPKTKTIVKDILEEPIVWFDGKAEIGPRALGHRSILADPRSEQSKIMLNKVKQRQWWRPVAPMILEKEIDNWIDNGYASPYMLHTFVFKENMRRKVPAVVHLDGTARVQTVNERDDKKIYELLHEFKESTGVPILCNTSLNDKGEPIINTIEEAMNFALRKKFRVIYINGNRIVLKNQNNYNENSPRKRENSNFYIYNSTEEKNKLLEYMNPYHLPMETLVLYFQNEKIRKKYSLKNEVDVKKLERITKLVYAKMGFENGKDALFGF